MQNLEKRIAALESQSRIADENLKVVLVSVGKDETQAEAILEKRLAVICPPHVRGNTPARPWVLPSPWESGSLRRGRPQRTYTKFYA